MNALTGFPPVVSAAAWLLTYLLHSTVLLGGAWLLSRVLRDHAARDALWKAALVGGVLTATLQVVGGVHVAGGRWEVQALGSASAPASPDAAPVAGASRAPDRAADRQERAETPNAGAPASPTAETPLASTADGASDLASPASPVSPAPSATETAGGDAGRMRVAGAWAAGIFGVWLAVAVLLLARLTLRHRWLHRLLADRQPVTEGPLPALLAEMRRNAGIWHPVFLSAAPGCPSPLALGTREICVPPRFLSELDEEQQRAALAHELAHVARRDPLWHLVVGIVEAVGFFQPLNRLARVKLREAAEFLADDWAVRQTGARMGLAKCLAQVASWVSPVAEPIPSGTMAMAEGGSPLLLRVQRLLDEPRDVAASSPAVRALAVVALLAFVVAAAPAVTPKTPTRAPVAAAVTAGETGTDGDETPLAAADDTLPRTVRVIRAPDATRPLETRWRWATATAARERTGRFWIAYATPGVIPAGTTSLADSGPWDMRELRDTPLASLLSYAAPQSGPAPVIFLARVRSGNGGVTVDRVSVRSPDVGGRFDGPIYFLGDAGTDESIDWLARLANEARDPGVRGTLYEAVGLHPGPRVMPILTRVARGDGSMDVRRSAVESLEWQRSDAALQFLVLVARTDGSVDVRRQAAESLGKLPHPGAEAALRDLMRNGRGEEVRTQALESLGSRDGSANAAFLFEVAMNDPDPALARQAAESLEEAPPAVALRYLREVAWKARDPQVARQATESLGNLASPAALEALDDIVARHALEDAVVQAVEAISKFGDADALPRLRRIARTHPMSRAREEAVDYLTGDRDVDVDRDNEDRAAFDPDPNGAYDPDPESAYDPDPQPKHDPNPNPSPKRAGKP